MFGRDAFAPTVRICGTARLAGCEIGIESGRVVGEFRDAAAVKAVVLDSWFWGEIRRRIASTGSRTGSDKTDRTGKYGSRISIPSKIGAIQPRAVILSRAARVVNAGVYTPEYVNFPLGAGILVISDSIAGH